jgi:putative endonuclease
MKRGGYTYILTNKNNTVLYTGVTNDLHRRLHEHREGHNINAFTKRYNCTKLVYFERYSMIIDAIYREKQIKGGSRAKKIALIESINPKWDDLSHLIEE